MIKRLARAGLNYVVGHSQRVDRLSATTLDVAAGLWIENRVRITDAQNIAADPNIV
jgi:hypothetical protein